ncbi:threonylcarbamoyl-AMP synthase [Clostridia bacterium]|nr:threonylcarbamoyl-AMP synthase [Clostridia bacterium]
MLTKVIMPDELEEAAQMILQGGIVAFPTETVYGLGAGIHQEEAIQKIYRVKGRPMDNPLIVHISQKEQMVDLTRKVSKFAKILLDTFCPGPLTLILPKKENLSHYITAGLDTVAIRIPIHPLAQKFIQLSGCPVAAPSANLSGRPSSTIFTHVKEDLWGKVDGIIKGDEPSLGLESTIVDVSVNPALILRPGHITLEMLEEVLGKGQIQYDPALLVRKEREGVAKAPGMKYKHYAPRADLFLLEGNAKAVKKKIMYYYQKKTEQGKKVGIMTVGKVSDYPQDFYRFLSKTGDEKQVASNLYRILREFDDLGVDYIYAENIRMEEGLSGAIFNRLIKAASYQIERVEDV